MAIWEWLVKNRGCDSSHFSSTNRICNAQIIWFIQQSWEPLACYELLSKSPLVKCF